MRSIKRYIGIYSLLLLAGCKWEPDCELLKNEMPAQYGMFAMEEVESPPMTDLVKWWEAFQDDTLYALVMEALQKNPEIDIKQQQIFERAAYYGIPEDNVICRIRNCRTFDIRRNIPGTRISDTEQFTVGANVQEVNGSLAIQNGLLLSLVDTNWELDIYQRQRLYKEAVCHEMRALVEDFENLLLFTKVKVAKTYTSIRAYQKTKIVFQQQLHLQQQLLELTEARKESGSSSEIDTNLVKNAMSQTEAFYTTIDVQLQEAFRDLAILLGEKDAPKLRRFVGDFGEIPTIPSRILPGVPIKLITMRPDVRASIQRVRERCQGLGIAWSEQFPLVGINPNILLNNKNVYELFNPASFFASLAGQLTYPLFQRWKIRSDIRVSRSQLEQAALDYQKILVDAIAEVELSMLQYVNAKRREDAYLVGFESSLLAFLQSEMLYRAGGGDILKLLNAQLGVIESRGRYIESTADAINSQLDIYRALGGSINVGERDISYH